GRAVHPHELEGCGRNLRGRSAPRRPGNDRLDPRDVRARADCIRAARRARRRSTPGCRVAPPRIRVRVPRARGARRLSDAISSLPARTFRARHHSRKTSRMIDYNAFLSRAAENMKESAIRRMGSVIAQKRDIISFAPGYPAPETFPWEEFQDIA